MDNLTLQQLGETESLKRTVARLKKSTDAIVGSGDDAAVLPATESFLVSTDTLVEDHDFKLDWSSGFDLGFKAVASNLADIAAMGATPTFLVVAVVIPKTTKISWLEDFADGLQAALNDLCPNASIVGGDIASGEKVMVSVTVHGELAGLAPVLRSGAQPGDIVAVAGTLGKAACGLAILESGNQDFIRSYDEWVLAQLQPRPPIAEGVVANRAGATSMMDVSDGLLKDLHRIARASSVAIEISSKDLNGYEAMLDLPAQALGVDPGNWVLTGGEDHALVATFPTGATLPKSFKAIGRVIQSDSPKVFLDGVEAKDSGWDSIIGKN